LVACGLKFGFGPGEQSLITLANGTDGVRLNTFGVGRNGGKGARHLQQGYLT
jgi:hypothetical protein